MYAFKQVVGALAMPLVAATLLALIAAALGALRWPRTARSLLVLAVAIAWVAALPVTGDALLGTTPLVLVTSAYRMPRAMLLIERAGAHAIPAPYCAARMGGADAICARLPAERAACARPSSPCTNISACSAPDSVSMTERVLVTCSPLAWHGFSSPRERE